MRSSRSPQALEQLCVSILERKRAWDEAAFEFFIQLKEVDPLLAQALIKAFGEEARAISWCVSVSPFLGRTPIELISQGQRQEVMDELMRIEHGVFT